MSQVAERIYQLLPEVYRRRDAEQDEVLREFIAVIAHQVELLEENLAQSYDDHFIETCAEWVVPYIGDLIAYRTLHGVVPKIASQRAEVANTIRARRRKGTASMLEQLARDVTGWNARAVEFFELLITQQYMNHQRLHNRTSPDMRDWEALERLRSAFDTNAYSVNVRRISLGAGKHNIPNIGIFLWRLDAFSLSFSPAVVVSDNQFMFSPLGANTQLVNRPQIEEEITHIAEPINVPEPISRRVLADYTGRYYGADRSFTIFDDGVEIPESRIISCNLSDDEFGNWAHEPTTSVAVDPVLGRIAFPALLPPQGEVRVSYYYGFSAKIAGGEYERRSTMELNLEVGAQVADSASIQSAFDTTMQSRAIEIIGSGRHQETLSNALNLNQSLELRALNGAHPTIELEQDWLIRGDENSELILNGLLITGAGLVIPDDSSISKLTLKHCTLVPGRSLTIGGQATQPGLPGLRIENENVTVVMEQCISGPIEFIRGATVELSGCIVDALSTQGSAIGPLQGEVDEVGGNLQIVNTSVRGRVAVAALPLASNTIFHAIGSVANPSPVFVLNKQTGCVRFSYVPPGSVVPRRYRCQPDLAVRDAIAEREKLIGTTLSAVQIASITAGVRAQLQPVFSDLRFTHPAYFQLHESCPVEIRSGADDESEMGVFHHLYQNQRETNLKIRLDEYLRFGLEAGFFYET